MPFCGNCGRQQLDNNACACKSAPEQPATDGLSAQAVVAPQPPPPPPGFTQQPHAQQPYMQPQQPNPYVQQPYAPYPPVPVKPKKPPGQTMIRVVGILATILGGIVLLASSAPFTAEYRDVLFAIPGFQAAAVFEVILGVLTLAFGITGIAAAKKKSMATAILGFGVSIIALNVIYAILGIEPYDNPVARAFVEDAYIDTLWGYVVMGTPLGILYIVGAVRRKNAPM